MILVRIDKLTRNNHILRQLELRRPREVSRQLQMHTELPGEHPLSPHVCEVLAWILHILCTIFGQQQLLDQSRHT